MIEIRRALARYRSIILRPRGHVDSERRIDKVTIDLFDLEFEDSIGVDNHIDFGAMARHGLLRATVRHKVHGGGAGHVPQDAARGAGGVRAVIRVRRLLSVCCEFLGPVFRRCPDPAAHRNEAHFPPGV